MSAASARSKPASDPPVSEERESRPEQRGIEVIRASMAAAPEVDWLTPEQLAACDQVLEDIRTDPARLVPDEDRERVFHERG